jgi:hypothetical protein
MVSKNKASAVVHSNSFVGIFWAIQDQGSAARIVDHRCSLKEAEPYGTMLTCPHGHYEVWEQWRKAGGRAAIAASEYEEWPRGRIVYDREGERFILYADAQILRDPALITAIHQKFGLPMERTDPKRDNHYQSTRRLSRPRLDENR